MLKRALLVAMLLSGCSEVPGSAYSRGPANFGTAKQFVLEQATAMSYESGFSQAKTECINRALDERLSESAAASVQYIGYSNKSQADEMLLRIVKYEASGDCKDVD